MQFAPHDDGPVERAVTHADTATPAEADAGDLELAHAVADGDRPAFTDLMRRHNQRLYRLARAVLRDATEAEDALQEAYLHAFRRMAQFRGESSLATWLSRLVLNECLGRIRRRERRGNAVPLVANAEGLMDEVAGDALERPENGAAREQMRRILEEKVDALPEAFRIIFVLRSVEELSVEEVAQCLSLPEATVRSRHFRARRLLREALSRQIDLAEREIFEFGGDRCRRIIDAVWRAL